MDATAFDIVVDGLALIGTLAIIFGLWATYLVCTKGKTPGYQEMPLLSDGPLADSRISWVGPVQRFENGALVNEDPPTV